MATISENITQAFMRGQRVNIRDMSTEGRIDAGWLHATVRTDSGSVFFQTGPIPSNPADWTRLGTLENCEIVQAPLNLVQRRRARLAIRLLSCILGGAEYDEAKHEIKAEKECSRCGKPLGSNVMSRELDGALVIVGPTCWEHLTGEFERKRLARAARLSTFLTRAARHNGAPAPAAPRCPGTCAVDAYCADCEA